MPSKALTFNNERGHQLSARLDLPDGLPRAFAVFAHCFTCSKNLNATAQVSRALAAKGIGVLRFDFTGLGASQGEFENTSFSGNVHDLIAAARFLEREYEAPQLLVGHSLGGAAVLRAAPALDTVRAVATIASPYHPEHVTRMLRPAREEIESQGRAEVDLGGRCFTITQEFVADLVDQPMQETIGQLHRALLVLHAPRDETVGIDNATEIFTAAKHPKSFVTLDGADHLLTKPADATYAGNVIASWAERYFDDPVMDEHEPAAAEGEEVVVRGPEQGFRTEIDAGGHALAADEPRRMGGTDSAAGPYGLLLAGLGACTAMTLRMYADRKGWPLRRADVRLSHAKVHATDCQQADDAGGGKLDKIERTITVLGDLDPQQRERLLQIADRCPVHRTLESDICIETQLADD